MTKDEALKRLHEVLKPGDTVYTVLRHVSASGMMRRISLFVIRPNEFDEGKPEPYVLDFLCEPVGLGKWDRDKGGIKIAGAGMDMGFDLVYRLGRILYPDGFKVEGVGRNGDTSGHDNDGGYALQHRWL